ncbi:MAG: diacylglycerol kinase family lipid kinase [Actinomycetota bacterium]|nr:diacylglycerol kinase family lipid kinase [Actinomycetota bacterium]
MSTPAPGHLLIASAKAGSTDDEALSAACAVLGAELSLCEAPDDMDAAFDRLDGRTLVIAGGDGSLHLAVTRLRARGALGSTRIGLVPLGTGNDLARVLGLPREIEPATALLAHGVPRTIDLGEARPASGGPGRAFVGIASLGFDSEANRIANAAPSRLGNLVYAYGALRALATWRSARFALTVRSGNAVERLESVGYTVAAANSGAYGGGMMLAPDARLDDGLLDVVTIGNVGRVRFLRTLPKVFAGSHVHEPGVEVLRAQEVEVDADRPFTVYADGDPIGETPIVVRALPGAVHVLVPPEAT